MAFETVWQRPWFPFRFPQEFYRYRNPSSYLNAMEYPAGSNESSDYEGFRNPSSRSSTGPVVMDPRYPESHATEIDSLRPTNTISSYGSATKYLPSRSYPSANGFNTNVSSNSNASSMEVGDYTNAPAFLEEPDGNMCFEPETIDPFCTAPNVADFIPLLPGWPPLINSLHAPNSLHDNYTTDFPTWPASTLPWPGTSSECSVREASNSQPRYQGALMDKNKIDAQTQSQRNPGQAKDDQTVKCQEVGCGKSFSRPGDLKRHHRELHDPGQKRFLCGCCNTKPDGFKREDKLINHKVKIHQFVRGSRLRTCPECYEANTLDILYFCSDDALERHRSLAHGISHSDDNTPTGRNDSQSEPTKVTGMQSLSDDNKSDTMLPGSTSTHAKRRHQIENENIAKRSKLDPVVHEIERQRMEIVSSKSLDVDSDGQFDLVKPGNESENAAAEEILVPDVGISDFFALSKDKVIRAIEENSKLNTAGGFEKPEISFNAFRGSIRLRGFGSITKAVKSIVYDLLGKRQRPGSSLNELTSLNLLCMRSKFPRVPPPQPGTGTKIFAMRHAEDAELLRVWHETIIPSLPDLLARTIGDNYSASLVRKGISELSWTAVIQIQSHTVPSETVRALIRNQIVRWVDKDISFRSSQVQFLKGRLTMLAGDLHAVHEISDSPERIDQGSDDEAEPEGYPYYKRYWGRPGPGASIGLLCTGSIAATICCYVRVEGQLFILTVKHLITKSYDRLLAGTSDITTVVSPALADVDDMREQFTQFVTDLNIELEEAMREYSGDEYSEYVPLGAIGSLPGIVKDIMQKLEIVQKDLTYLTGGDRPFRLGSLAYQSTTPSNSDRPLLSLPGQRFGHHTDWALISVLPERAGTNRHRYQYDYEERADDFYTGDIDTFGAGQPFLDTCVLEPNDEVHFVGRTGRQTGEINAARVLIRHNGIVSEELTMVTSANRQDGNDSLHRGDSGASIIRDSDNKLGGLLWARTKDGQLVLTPINMVFDDIRQKVPASDVSLPPIDRSSPPDMPLSTAVHEVDTICHDKTIERPKLRRKLRSSDMPSPKRKGLPASSRPERFPVGSSQPSVTKTMSLPTPLLGSQRIPVFIPPNTVFGPVLPAPAYIQLAQQVFRAVEDNKNKHSLGFILTEYSANKLEKRSTFPPTQDRAVHRTGTWPAKNHLRFASRNARALNAISVN